MDDDRMSDTERDNESDIDDDQDCDSDEVEALGTIPANGKAVVWKQEAADIIMTDFQQQTGPQHDLQPDACPLDFFLLMFPLALINILVEQTNVYAQQCMVTTPNNSWYETTVEEMRAFLSIQIIFGIRHLPRLWCYWSQDHRFNDPWVSSIMPINRFKNLSGYFHCRDTMHQPQRGENGFDSLFKVRNIITATQETLRQYFQAGRELSVDECMVAFKGRLSFLQYMPAKPTKWGVKVWTICDSKTGFCLGYDIYTGKNSRKDPRKPLGFEVVDVLSSPHYNIGHHIYVDRFFNSVDLGSHLLTTIHIYVVPS